MNESEELFERLLGGWLRSLSNTVSLSYAKILEGSGVTAAELVVLRAIQAGEGNLAPSEIAHHLGMTRGAVSKLTDRLITKRLVTRTESKSDRRFQVVRLTSAASKMIPELLDTAKNNDERFFSCLSRSERSEFERLIKKVLHKNSLKNIATK
jgi:DNA-binding MarR family transcriptional regulator